MMAWLRTWWRAKRQTPAAPTSPWRRVAPGLLERPFTAEDAEFYLVTPPKRRDRLTRDRRLERGYDLSQFRRDERR